MGIRTQVDHFHIVQRLGGSCKSAVFLATDLDEKQVVLKLWSDEVGFFNELARYYAVGDLEIAPELLENMPPEIAGGDEWLSRAFLESLNLSNWKPRQVGLLVFAYIEGPEIENAFRKLESHQALRLFLDLAQRLQEVHRLGEYHGQLSLANLALQASTTRLCLWDWGHHEGSITGLEDSETDTRKGQMNDVNQLLSLILNLLPSQSPLQAQLEPFLEVRTQLYLSQLIQLLEDHWADAAKSDSPNRTKRRLTWAIMSFFAVFSTSLAITSIYKNPVDEQRSQLISAKQLDDAERIQKLFDLRESLNLTPNTLEFVTRDIARIKKGHARYQVSHVERAQLERPLAVLHIQKEPLFFTSNVQLALGDWVELEGEPYYVSAIDLSGMDFKTESGKQDRIAFASTGMQLGALIDQDVAVVWPVENNLSPLVRSLGNWFYHQKGQKLKIPSWLADGSFQTKETDENSLYGIYKVNSMEGFFESLDQQIHAEKINEGQLLSVPISAAPKYSYGYVSFLGLNKITILRELAKKLNVELIYRKSFKDEIVPNLAYEQIEWQDLMNNIGIQWEVVKNGSSYQLIIK